MTLPYQEVAEMLETGLDRLEEGAKRPTLPDQGDYQAADELVLAASRTEMKAYAPRFSDG